MGIDHAMTAQRRENDRTVREQMQRMAQAQQNARWHQLMSQGIGPAFAATMSLAGIEPREQLPPDELLNNAIAQATETIKHEREKARRFKLVLDGHVELQWIEDENNAEIRRVMIDRYGFQRYMEDAGYNVIARDKYGELIERRNSMGWRHSGFRAVRVQNSSPEPDGTHKWYILRVPIWIENPKQGIAWTFGLEEKDYNPELMT